MEISKLVFDVTIKEPCLMLHIKKTCNTMCSFLTLHRKKMSIMDKTNQTNDLSAVDQDAIEVEGKLPENGNESYETDLDIEERKGEFDRTGKSCYLASCEKTGAVPLSCFIRNVANPILSLRYHGMGAIGAYSLSKALFTNTVIVELDLYENYIGPSGAKAMANMLKENCYVTTLNLGRNCLTSTGCKYICDMLQLNTSLMKLDLSSNEFGDKVGEQLSDALKNNDKLSWLNLSSNDLGEKVGIELGPAINMNDALEYLDLSWNQIRGKGAADIANGVWSNCTLRYLDLSWNGFGNSGALALAEALRANNTLTELDVSHNRIGTDGAVFMGKGISGNNTLEKFKMNGNPIKCEGAFYILSTIHGMLEISLQQLHLKEITVDEEFETIYEAIKERSGLKVFADFVKISALKKLNNLVERDRKNWAETFEELDEHGISRVPKDVFFKVVESLGLSLDLEDKLVLASKLKSDSFGNVYYKHALLGFSKEKPPNQDPV